MQDRYTGDIGDFGKYGLLRALTQTEENQAQKLGIVWYLNPDETGNRDGRHTGYLAAEGKDRRRFAACDEELYQALAQLVGAGRRSVKAVQESGILPPGTVYHDETLTLKNLERPRGKTLRQAQMERRESWNRAALEKTGDCEIVFLDPDNGLETASVKPHMVRAAKYAFYSELETYLSRGQSLMVYHHLDRSSKSLQQVHRRQREIYEKLGRRTLVMRYYRGSPRAFILIPQNRHRELVMERTRGMLAGAWSRHFTMIL